MNLIRGKNRLGFAGVILFIAAMAEAVTALVVVPRAPVESRFAHPRPAMVVQTMSELPAGIVENRAGTIEFNPPLTRPEPPAVSVPEEQPHGCESYVDFMSSLPPAPAERRAYTETGVRK